MVQCSMMYASSFSFVSTTLSPPTASIKPLHLISRRPKLPLPNPNIVFSAVEDFINTFVDPPTRPSVDPRRVLAGNFAPVDELPPTECEIVSHTGHIPACLDGAYLRNGPNPQFSPRGPYHLFDGDGMLHCLRVSDGGARATLCSRYVRTNKFTVERREGSQVFPNVFAAFNCLLGSAARMALAYARSVAGQFHPRDGFGLANTSLALVAGKLFALCECDLPYEVAVTGNGDVVTLGRCDLDGELVANMTAHPKTDPVTRETFAFRYFPVYHPSLTYFRLDASGKKIGPEVPIFSLNKPLLVHDFAITVNFAIFADIQIGLDFVGLVLRGGSLIAPDPTKVPRLGVIPRYASDESEMRWFDVPEFNPLHAINAWDETDLDTGSESVVLVAPNIMSIEHFPESVELLRVRVEKVRIDLETGQVSRVPVSSRNLDLAVINPNRIGRKNRFVYAAVGPFPKTSGVVKLDLEVEGKDGAVAERMFDDGCYGGEPFFVAKDPEDGSAEEDDGYVVSFMHNEKTGESKFLVMDAKSSELEVVAEVKLPQRVPYGFHGIFVTEKSIS